MTYPTKVVSVGEIALGPVSLTTHPGSAAPSAIAGTRHDAPEGPFEVARIGPASLHGPPGFIRELARALGELADRLAAPTWSDEPWMCARAKAEAQIDRGGTVSVMPVGLELEDPCGEEALAEGRRLLEYAAAERGRLIRWLDAHLGDLD